MADHPTSPLRLPTHDDAEAVDRLLQRKKYQDAHELAEQFKPAANSTELTDAQARILCLNARALAWDGRVRGAQSLLQRYAKNFPENKRLRIEAAYMQVFGAMEEGDKARTLALIEEQPFDVIDALRPRLERSLRKAEDFPSLVAICRHPNHLFDHMKKLEKSNKPGAVLELRRLRMQSPHFDLTQPSDRRTAVGAGLEHIRRGDMDGAQAICDLLGGMQHRTERKLAAKLCYHQGKLAEAEALYSLLLEDCESPQERKSISNTLFDIYIIQEKWDAAIEARPNSQKLLNLIQSFIRNDEWQKAIALGDRFIASDHFGREPETDSSIFKKLVGIVTDRGLRDTEFDRIQYWFDRACEALPETPASIKAEGMRALERGELDEAVEKCREALRRYDEGNVLLGKPGNLYCSLGRALFERGAGEDKKEAIGLLRKGMELGHRHSGLALARIGRHEQNENLMCEAFDFLRQYRPTLAEKALPISEQHPMAQVLRAMHQIAVTGVRKHAYTNHLNRLWNEKVIDDDTLAQFSPGRVVRTDKLGQGSFGQLVRALNDAAAHRAEPEPPAAASDHVSRCGRESGPRGHHDDSPRPPRAGRGHG